MDAVGRRPTRRAASTSATGSSTTSGAPTTPGMRAIHVPHSTIPRRARSATPRASRTPWSHRLAEIHGIVSLVCGLVLGRLAICRFVHCRDVRIGKCRRRRSACCMLLQTRSPRRSPHIGRNSSHGPRCPGLQRSAYSSVPGSISGVPRKTSSRTAAMSGRSRPAPYAPARGPGAPAGGAAEASSRTAASRRAATAQRRWGRRCWRPGRRRSPRRRPRRRAPRGHGGGGAQARQLVRRLGRDRRPPEVRDTSRVSRSRRARCVAVGRRDRGEQRRVRGARRLAAEHAVDVDGGVLGGQRGLEGVEGRHAPAPSPAPEDGQVLGDAGRHAGEQPGQGAALRPPPTSRPDRLWALLAAADRARAGAGPDAGPGPSPTSADRSSSRASRWATWSSCRRGHRPARAAGWAAATERHQAGQVAELGQDGVDRVRRPGRRTALGGPAPDRSSSGSRSQPASAPEPARASPRRRRAPTARGSGAGEDGHGADLIGGPGRSPAPGQIPAG